MYPRSLQATRISSIVSRASFKEWQARLTFCSLSPIRLGPGNASSILMCGAADGLLFENQPQWESGMSQGGPLFFAAALVIAGLVLLAFGGRAYLQEQRYAREGQLLTGTVVDDSRQVGRSGGTTSFETLYEFVLPDGQIIRGKDVIDAKFFQGARVEIEYLANEPARSRIRAVGSAYEKRMWVFLGLGAAFLFVGLYLVAYDFRQR